MRRVAPDGTDASKARSDPVLIQSSLPLLQHELLIAHGKSTTK
jgi:hypothetical protein